MVSDTVFGIIVPIAWPRCANPQTNKFLFCLDSHTVRAYQELGVSSSSTSLTSGSQFQSSMIGSENPSRQVPTSGIQLHAHLQRYWDQCWQDLDIIDWTSTIVNFRTNDDFEWSWPAEKLRRLHGLDPLCLSFCSQELFLQSDHPICYDTNLKKIDPRVAYFESS